MTTYAPESKPERADYAVEAMLKLARYLRVPGAYDVMVHISDDVSASASCLKMIAGAETIVGAQRVAFHQKKHSGIGGSLNHTLSSLSPDDIWLYTTDDWVLTAPLDLTKALRLMQGAPAYEMVRLGPIHPNVYCKTVFQQDIGWWLQLHEDMGGYVFATRPFLARVGPFQRRGFKEHCDAYECEKEYAEYVGSGSSELYDIAAVVDAQGLEGPWEHIGAVEVGDVYVP